MNKYLNEIFDRSPELQELLTTIQVANNEKKLQKKQEQDKKINYINSQNSFVLYLQYHHKLDNNLYYEEIQLEGIDNALNIMNIYRSIGHDLNLNLLSLNVNDENSTRVKKIKFTY